MNNFLIICGSNLNNSNSKNYVVANMLGNWLKDNYPNLKIESIYFNSFPEVPFIDNELLKTDFFPNELNGLYASICNNQNLIFVTPEHNSNFSANFKNIFDWISVKNINFLKNKKVFLISVSDTKRVERGLKITGKLTFESVGCDWYHFIDWKSNDSISRFQKIIQLIS